LRLTEWFYATLSVVSERPYSMNRRVVQVADLHVGVTRWVSGGLATSPQ